MEGIKNFVTIFSILLLSTVWLQGVQYCSTFYNQPAGTTTPNALAFSPNGSYLAVVNSGDGGATDPGAAVTIFKVNSSGLTQAINYALPSGSRNALALAFSPDGSYLATLNSSEDITLFTISSGVPSNGTNYPLPTGTVNYDAIAFSPDGKYIAVPTSATDTAGTT